VKLFYGFHYRGGRNTTTGDPHPTTGRMSIAGNLKVFATGEARDEWVDAEIFHVPDSGFREAVTTKQQAKELWAGLSISEFNEYIRQEAILLEDDADFDHHTWLSY